MLVVNYQNKNERLTMNSVETADHAIAVDELKAQAKTPEDHAAIDAWKAELDEARENAKRELGAGTVKLVQQPDGSLATAQEHATMVSQGQDRSGASSAGRQV